MSSLTSKNICSASLWETPCFSFLRAFPSSQSKPTMWSRSITDRILLSYTFEGQAKYAEPLSVRGSVRSNLPRPGRDARACDSAQELAVAVRIAQLNESIQFA